MNFEEFFCQKSAGSAGWVKFVTAFLGNAPIMENVGLKCPPFPRKINKLGTMGGGGDVFENIRIDKQCSF